MNYLIRLLIALPVAVLVNTLLGVIIAKRKLEFDKTILWNGLLSSLGIYVSIGGLVFIGYLIPTISVVLNGDVYTILDGIAVIVLATIMKYVVDAFAKGIKMANLPKEMIIEEVEDSGTIEYDEVELG